MKLLEQQKQKTPFSGTLEFAGVDTRNAFLKVVYAAGLVEASEFSAHCADKLLFARFIESILPNGSIHPKTRGVKELLPNLAENIHREFRDPLVKPVASMGSDGKGIYFSIDDFLQKYSADPEFFLVEEISPLTGILSSGEKFLIQEKVGQREGEYRLHSLEGRVVRGATFTRWDHDWNEEKFSAAENALQQFLDQLPSWFTARQAWSFDLMESDSGFWIVEVNTNRGRQKHWSGDLVNPDTLRAYAEHVQKFYGAKFLSAGAQKLLNGEASAEQYVEKFGEEAVRRHELLRKGMKLKKK